MRSARVPKCQKIKKDLLDQYGDECFGKLIFATIRKRVGLEGLSGNVLLTVGDWFQTDQWRWLVEYRLQQAYSSAATMYANKQVDQ